MTDYYTTPTTTFYTDGRTIFAAILNLFVAGAGFAVYGDWKRFVKYFVVAIIASFFTFGIAYVFAELLSIYKVLTHQ